MESTRRNIPVEEPTLKAKSGLTLVSRLTGCEDPAVVEIRPLSELRNRAAAGTRGKAVL